MTRKLWCAIPRCQRFHYEDTAVRWWGGTDVRFICRSHWRLLTRDERRVWSKIKRLGKRYGDDAVAERRVQVFGAFVRMLSESNDLNGDAVIRPDN